MENNYRRPARPKRLIFTNPITFQYGSDNFSAQLEFVIKDEDENSRRSYWTIQNPRFQQDAIRLYVPPMCRFKDVKTKFSQEEVKKLFAGESIHVEDLQKKDGSKYGADFSFNPQELPAMSNPRYKGVVDEVRKGDDSETYLDWSKEKKAQ